MTEPEKGGERKRWQPLSEEDLIGLIGQIRKEVPGVDEVLVSVGFNTKAHLERDLTRTDLLINAPGSADYLRFFSGFSLTVMGKVFERDCQLKYEFDKESSSYRLTSISVKAREGEVTPFGWPSFILEVYWSQEDQVTLGYFDYEGYHHELSESLAKRFNFAVDEQREKATLRGMEKLEGFSLSMPLALEAAR